MITKKEKVRKSRNTPAKRKILSILKKTDAALSHQDVQQGLQDEFDRVTIYRVLDRLVEEGIAHKVIDMHGVSHFAFCHNCEDDDSHQHSHIHFNCEKCEKVTCIESAEPPLKLEGGYKINEVNLLVSGLCPDCNDAG